LVKFYQNALHDLILYARQLAWFHSTPAFKGVKTAKASDSEQTLTRGQKIERNGGTPLMPEVGEAAYLIGYWHDLGLVSAGAMSGVVLSAAEIAAWREGLAIELSPWEFMAIREMSRAYLSQSRESEKEECPPPYGEVVKEFDRDVVGSKISNTFKALIQARRK
jgi:hypothetical protein